MHHHHHLVVVTPFRPLRPTQAVILTWSCYVSLVRPPSLRAWPVLRLSTGVGKRCTPANTRGRFLHHPDTLGIILHAQPAAGRFGGELHQGEGRRQGKSRPHKTSFEPHPANQDTLRIVRILRRCTLIAATSTPTSSQLKVISRNVITINVIAVHVNTVNVNWSLRLPACTTHTPFLTNHGEYDRSHCSTSVAGLHLLVAAHTSHRGRGEPARA